MAVQTFKVGMDYIDPSYLTGVTGRPCRNLDTFVMDREDLMRIFFHGMQGSDLGLIEGVRGLYEGAESLEDTGSSAAVAKLLNVPVVLVVSARSITRSAAAIVRGFQSFDPAIDIRGIILNNVSGSQHIRKATEAIEHHCGIPVIGAVPRQPEMELAMRHLGLVPYLEGKAAPAFLKRIEAVTAMVGDHIDLDALLGLARPVAQPPGTDPFFEPADPPATTIAVALDEAFNFYYADLFDVLRAEGARVTTFSPVHDILPDADGYIFGGGYPELFLNELEANDRMREAVFERSREGAPIYAECGGLMYLTGGIRTLPGWQGSDEGESCRMCGVFEGETVMPAKRVVSYVEGESLGRNPVGPGRFRGHEFHYSDVILPENTRFSYVLSRGKGIRGQLDGALMDNTIGSYTHLHPVSSRGMFSSFVSLCRDQSRR
jgi:cobyrinic acid a,c-diamide synthase